MNDNDLPLPDLLMRLDAEGQEVVALALGEALRVGRHWLGIEFLLMGLSRQDGRALPTLLAEWGIEPGLLRGLLRGLAGITAQEDWRAVDPAQLGSQALAALSRGDSGLVVTPRAMVLLRQGVCLAGSGLAGHCHLLAAALELGPSPALGMLWAAADEAGWTRNRLKEWIRQQLIAPPLAASPTGGPLPVNVPAAVACTAADAVAQRPAVDLPHQPLQQSPRPALASPLGGLLGRFGRDLTAAAFAGALDPPIGMEAILRRVKRILIQPQSNNVLLIGEPGVGKTALVEGLALDLALSDPGVAELWGRRIVELRINDLVAGTSYRGQLEERVAQLVAEARAHPEVILFIDEIHTLVGGGHESLSNLSNALKPALARGEFPCIGATTPDEYQRTLEKDAALTRRFQVVRLKEPDFEACRGILAERFGERIPQEVLDLAIQLASRYRQDRYLPDSAIQLLTQAESYVRLPSLDGRAPDGEAAPRFTAVSGDLLRYLLEHETGIPITQAEGKDLALLQDLEARLAQQVVGQAEAVKAVAQVIRRARAGLADPHRPVGVFLFVGPTGVGKTELARALARILFGSTKAMVQLDMSEYMEKHQVARLIGAPPGYVGYQEEGQLTAALRAQPHCIVLLDEADKAHPDVHHLFLQLFAEGRLTDSQGRTADGRDALFIMTSNVGSEQHAGEEPLGFLHDQPNARRWVGTQRGVEQAIQATFKPEFLNRIDRIVYFCPLSPTSLRLIFDIKFAVFQRRLAQAHSVRLSVTPAAKEHVCNQGYDARRGARPLTRAIETLVVDPLTDRLLAGEFGEGDTVMVDYDGQQLVFRRQG